MEEHIPYKSFCWVVGTTSFRTKEFNIRIEQQLILMEEFWAMKPYEGGVWQSNELLQQAYYDFLKERKFIKGDAPRPAKDARQKTSGLVDMGLLDEERRITEAGKKLIAVLKSGVFTPDNFLEIPRDSFVYLKQMLKTSKDLDGKIVRPFIVFLYLLSRVGYLTKEEFTYLLPLCIDGETTERIAGRIPKVRSGILSCEDVIIETLLEKDNYKAALQLFLESPITEELFCKVGMNRKRREYDKAYYPLYCLLNRVILKKDEEAVLPLFECVKKLRLGGLWRKFLFNTQNRSVVQRKKSGALNSNRLTEAKNEREFKLLFFKTLHMYKASSLLSDYFDLNRRYFKNTDTVLFEESTVKLDVLPECYFMEVAGKLFAHAFTGNRDLNREIPLEEIAACLKPDKRRLYERLSDRVGRPVGSGADARDIIRDERYRRFNLLVDSRFPRRVLVELLLLFEKREDEEIRRIVTDNADIPTIFEYILGVAWYVISDRKGEILEYMNLSLEADLLPRTHAGGGEADIVYRYQGTEYYPRHTLLIEATLADKNNQRRMEMEPVSRHLGDYLLEHPEEIAYCIFIATYLHLNVIQDFRMRRNNEYYNEDGSKAIRGMKILPMETKILRLFLEKGTPYREIYKMFEAAYHAENGGAKEWYEKEIVYETTELEKYREQ